MRRRFGLPPEPQPHRKVVILSINARTVGLIVDQVTDVVRAPKNSIQPAPGLLDATQAPFFMGICSYQGRELILLNVKAVIGTDAEVVPQSAQSLMATGVEE
jgi:purine-binding chemotaxis protein CheW